MPPPPAQPLAHRGPGRPRNGRRGHCRAARRGGRWPPRAPPGSPDIAVRSRPRTGAGTPRLRPRGARVPLATAQPSVCVGHALLFSPVERRLFHEEARPLIALAGPTPPHDDGESPLAFFARRVSAASPPGRKTRCSMSAQLMHSGPASSMVSRSPELAPQSAACGLSFPWLPSCVTLSRSMFSRAICRANFRKSAGISSLWPERGPIGTTQRDSRQSFRSRHS